MLDERAPTPLSLAWRQYRLERRLFWRNPSAAFFNFLLPLLFLVAGGIILHGNQTDLNKLVPSIAGMAVMSTTFTALSLQHRVPARARRAQAHPRHAAADDLLLRRRGRQRGHQHGAADRDHRGRRARCSSASTGRPNGVRCWCSSSPASSASRRSAWRSRTRSRTSSRPPPTSTPCSCRSCSCRSTCSTRAARRSSCARSRRRCRCTR